MQVRPSTLADLAVVDALLARSYPKLLKADYPPSVLVTALPLISRAQPKLLSSGTYYVAEEAQNILGAGGWTPDRLTKRKGHIRHVVTDHRMLRRGVGRALIEHCFTMAHNAGMRELEAWATRTAVPFYSALGFDTLGAIEVPLAPGIAFPCLRMSRTL